MQDSDVKELFSAIRMLKDKMDKVVVLVENVEKQIKELKKEDLAQKENSKKILDPYSKENFIIRGDYIELKEPIGNIKMIERWCVFNLTWEGALRHAKNLRIGGFNDWRLPTIEELIVMSRIKVCGIDRCDDYVWSSSIVSDITDINREDFYDDDSYNFEVDWLKQHLSNKELIVWNSWRLTETTPDIRNNVLCVR